MRLKDYVRNQKKRKDYVQHPGFLMVGVDVSKAKNDAYMWTKAGVICRKLGSTNTRERFNRNILEQSRLECLFNH